MYRPFLVGGNRNGNGVVHSKGIRQSGKKWLICSMDFATILLFVLSFVALPNCFFAKIWGGNHQLKLLRINQPRFFFLAPLNCCWLKFNEIVVWESKLIVV